MRRFFNIGFYTFNVKYYTEGRNSDSYAKLLELIYETEVKINTRSNDYMFVRFLSKQSTEGVTFYSGILSRFTNLNGDWVNIKTKEIESFETPENLYPNLKETEFVFIPDCHRFVIKSNSFNVNTVIKFLEQAFNKVKDPDTEVIVNVEQSKDVYDKIFDASVVKRLNVDISYTNDDFSDDTEKWMDEMLKDAHVNEFSFVAKPDSTGSINVENNFLKGTLELAQKNGEVTATIVNSNNKTERIVTRNHPLKETVKVDVSADRFVFGVNVTKFLMAKFRPNG